jgi:hypothetical protein
MSEMRIESPEVKHLVNDYDIVFQGGVTMAVTVDISAGDTLEFGEKLILVHLTAKPSPTDPDTLLAPEDITIFVPHVLSIQRREREVRERTPDEYGWLFQPESVSFRLALPLRL